MRRRLFGSVRARATLGATLVVAVALLAAGASVLLALRSNLTDQASSEAESSARKVAVSIATGTAPAALELPDGDDTPVQVVDGDGGSWPPVRTWSGSAGPARPPSSR